VEEDGKPNLQDVLPVLKKFKNPGCFQMQKQSCPVLLKHHDVQTSGHFGVSKQINIEIRC